MNIKQHIEAGHYPKDEKGRALVPTLDGAIVTIGATDKPGKYSILGWIPTQAVVSSLELAWTETGYGAGAGCGNALQPPPPRKVEVKRWAVIRRNDGSVVNWWDSEADAKCAVMDHPDAQRRIIVQMVGSYEEPWS